MAARGARQHLVMESLGPAPVRVACVDAGDSLWAWQWEDAFAHERGGFPGDHGPWSGRGDTLSDPSQGFAEEFFYYDDQTNDLQHSYQREGVPTMAD